LCYNAKDKLPPIFIKLASKIKKIPQKAVDFLLGEHCVSKNFSSFFSQIKVTRGFYQKKHQNKNTKSEEQNGEKNEE
jgi:hypothetical protein